MARNEEPEEMFKWVGVIIIREVFVYKPKGRPGIKARSAADLKPCRLGGIREGARTMCLRKKDGLTAEEATDAADNPKKLQS